MECGKIVERSALVRPDGVRIFTMRSASDRAPGGKLHKSEGVAQGKLKLKETSSRYHMSVPCSVEEPHGSCETV